MNGFKSINFKIEGVVPLLMANNQAANPLNHYAKAMKEITKKRTKTDDDHARLSDIEWETHLYLNTEKRVVIPGRVIEGAISKAAGKVKAKDAVKAGVICPDDPRLIYKGPQDLDKLRADPRFRDVRACRPQGKTTVMRSRPIFDEWSLEFELLYDPEEINPETLVQILALGCIGDYRPRYGRYRIVSAKYEKVGNPASRKSA